jgi:hypothetical protein
VPERAEHTVAIDSRPGAYYSDDGVACDIVLLNGTTLRVHAGNTIADQEQQLVVRQRNAEGVWIAQWVVPRTAIAYTVSYTREGRKKETRRDERKRRR